MQLSPLKLIDVPRMRKLNRQALLQGRTLYVAVYPLSLIKNARNGVTPLHCAIVKSHNHTLASCGSLQFANTTTQTRLQ